MKPIEKKQLLDLMQRSWDAMKISSSPQKQHQEKGEIAYPKAKILSRIGSSVDLAKSRNEYVFASKTARRTSETQRRCCIPKTVNEIVQEEPAEYLNRQVAKRRHDSLAVANKIKEIEENTRNQKTHDCKEWQEIQSNLKKYDQKRNFIRSAIKS
jgi:hypothetical protein